MLSSTTPRLIGANVGCVTMTECSFLSSDELKTYATTLGDAFMDDINNINNGYPILKWQLEQQ